MFQMNSQSIEQLLIDDIIMCIVEKTSTMNDLLSLTLVNKRFYHLCMRYINIKYKLSMYPQLTTAECLCLSMIKDTSHDEIFYRMVNLYSPKRKIIFAFTLALMIYVEYGGVTVVRVKDEEFDLPDMISYGDHRMKLSFIEENLSNNHKKGIFSYREYPSDIPTRIKDWGNGAQIWGVNESNNVSYRVNMKMMENQNCIMQLISYGGVIEKKIDTLICVQDRIFSVDCLRFVAITPLNMNDREFDQHYRYTIKYHRMINREVFACNRILPPYYYDSSLNCGTRTVNHIFMNFKEMITIISKFKSPKINCTFISFATTLIDVNSKPSNTYWMVENERISIVKGCYVERDGNDILDEYNDEDNIDVIDEYCDITYPHTYRSHLIQIDLPSIIRNFISIYIYIYMDIHVSMSDMKVLINKIAKYNMMIYFVYPK